MAHIRVKDMPRRQQRAVFASMGDGSTGTVSENDLSAKRERLAKEGLVTESVQDKKDRILQDKRLTHRQKMDRIAKLGMQPEKSARQHGSATIVRVPGGIDRESFNYIVMKKKLPSTNLYDSGELLLTQEEYVRGVKNRGKLPKGSKIIEAPSGGNRRVFDAYMYKAKAKPGTYVRDGKLVLSMTDYKKGLHRNARVRYNVRDWKEKHRIEQDLIIKETKKGYTEKGIRPPGIAAIYEKALAAHDEKKQASEKKYKMVMKFPAVGNEPECLGESQPVSREKAEAAARKTKKLGYWAGVVSADAKPKGKAPVERVEI